MEKMKILIAAATILIAGAIFHSCQKETMQPVKEQGTMVLKNGGIPCEEYCIDENTGDAFAATHSATLNWGGQAGLNNGKTLTVNVWNTLTTIEYEFTITGYGNAYSPGNLQYFDEDLDDWVNAGSLTTDVAFPVSRPLPEDWKACDPVIEQWRQTGGGEPVELGAVTYLLIGPCGCDDEFDTDLECGGEGEDHVFTVTFKAGEDGDYVIQGGLNAKVDGDLVTYTATTGSFNQTHPGVVNSNANVIRWEGYLHECDVITIVVTFNGKCETGEWTVKLDDD